MTSPDTDPLDRHKHSEYYKLGMTSKEKRDLDSFFQFNFCILTTSCSQIELHIPLWAEVTQGPKAVELTASQLGSTGEIGHRAKNTYLCLSLSLSIPSSLKGKSKTENLNKRMMK